MKMVVVVIRFTPHDLTMKELISVSYDWGKYVQNLLFVSQCETFYVNLFTCVLP